MPIGFTLLLGFQLLGEALAQLLGLTVPGPVLGLMLLVAALLLAPSLRRAVEPTADALLRSLSLLFVPAAVGVVQLLPVLRTQGVAIGAALLLSTVAALAVTALTFHAVRRALGLPEEPR